MRKVAGALCLLFSLGITTKALGALAKAIGMMTAPADTPYKSLYTEEYFLTFAFLLIFAGFLLWQGVRLMRRPRLR